MQDSSTTAARKQEQSYPRMLSKQLMIKGWIWSTSSRQRVIMKLDCNAWRHMSLRAADDWACWWHSNRLTAHRQTYTSQVMTPDYRSFCKCTSQPAIWLTAFDQEVALVYSNNITIHNVHKHTCWASNDRAYGLHKLTMTNFGKNGLKSYSNITVLK